MQTMPHDTKYRDRQRLILIFGTVVPLTKTLLKSQNKVFAENLKHPNASLFRQELVCRQHSRRRNK